MKATNRAGAALLGIALGSGACVSPQGAGPVGTEPGFDGSIEDATLAVPEAAAPDAGTPDTAPPGDATIDSPVLVLVDAAVDADAALPGCSATQKMCDGGCVSETDPNYGCASASCQTCAGDPEGTYDCDASGACELSGCLAGSKLCGGACVSIANPAYGCGTTSCDSSSCPSVADGGTLVCTGNTCAVGTCGAGAKQCGAACVPADEAHGCDSTASCTACAGDPQGIYTCAAGACSLSGCNTGYKLCGAACVPTDAAHGCATTGVCTACASGACSGTPSLCCTDETVAALCGSSFTLCGPQTDNCGNTVQCPTPASAYPPFAGCPGGDHDWDCWHALPVNRTLGQSSGDYTIVTLCGGDVVKDNATGLMWDRNERPGIATSVTAAASACTSSTSGGFTDWRLPTLAELRTLFDYDRTTVPTLDTATFNGTSVTDPNYAVFTSTPDPFVSGPAANYGVLFNGSGSSGTSQGNVRCVR